MQGSQLFEVSVRPPETEEQAPATSTRVRRKSSAALIDRDDFSAEKAQLLADEIFQNVDVPEQSELDFHHFVNFLEQNPKIMDTFARSFREELWVNRLHEQISELESPKSPKVTADPTARCCFVFKRTKSASAHVLTQPNSASPLREVKAGWLSKLAADGATVQKVFVTLKSSVLLLYSRPSSAVPEMVVFMDGCYVEKVGDGVEGVGFGIGISHQFETFQIVTMFAATDSERDEWVSRLQLAAHTRCVTDFYRLSERIGTGRYSNVFIATELETNFTWAIKVIDKSLLSESEREMLRSELAILRLLNHKNVVQMKEFFEDKKTIYIVMELVEGGELFTRIVKKKVFSEYTAYYITRQLLDTVKYLHDVGIIHRDIKPENILLSDNTELPTIKLADFGLSKLVGPDDRLFVPCGTLAYVAPEILTKSGYNRQADMWSIGVVTYLMLRGRLPFDSKDKNVIIEKTIEARLDLSHPYWSKLTPHALDFLEKLLTRNVDQRLSCDSALLHPWMRNGNILIPRKINRRTLEEDMLRKTITNAKLQNEIYEEKPKAATIDPADTANTRFMYTTPEIYEDMMVERRYAERTIDLKAD